MEKKSEILVEMIRDCKDVSLKTGLTMLVDHIDEMNLRIKNLEEKMANIVEHGSRRYQKGSGHDGGLSIS
jgi:hypothetical protein